jgi:hypothetical protein
VHALLREAASELAVHFIYHVPKCAGQTVDRHLAGALAPDVYCRTTRRRGVGRFLASRHAFEQPPDPHRTKVISGHHLGPSVEPLVAGRKVRRSILLRDPVSHAVSYYNFRMMRYLSEGLHPYSFALAYGAMQRNFIAHYILRNFLEVPWHRLARFSDNDKYDIVNAFLATFWFVGDYRLCDDLVAALAATLNIPDRAAPTNTCAEWERRVSWKRLGTDQLSCDAIAEIRRENLIDQKLWETWRDARHDAALVRPRALAGSGASSLSTEAMRFVCQIARRIQRRWGPLEVPAVPAVEGHSAATI